MWTTGPRVGLTCFSPKSIEPALPDKVRQLDLASRRRLLLSFAWTTLRRRPPKVFVDFVEWEDACRGRFWESRSSLACLVLARMTLWVVETHRLIMSLIPLNNLCKEM